MTNKRQTYSEETLQEAVRLCNEEGMSYGDAQLSIGILGIGIVKKLSLKNN